MNNYHPVLYYDGVCALCNHIVKLILKNLHQCPIYITPLQGNYASKNLTQPVKPDSIIFYYNNTYYYKSKAVFEIIKLLHPRVSWLAWFRILPVKLTDFFYDAVARYRYKIWGKYSVCPLPPAHLKHLFID